MIDTYCNTGSQAIGKNVNCLIKHVYVSESCISNVPVYQFI